MPVETTPLGQSDARSCSLCVRRRKPLSAEHKAKISAGNKGRKRGEISDEHRQKLSESLKEAYASGRKIPSKVAAQKGAEAAKRRKGVAQSAEHIEKAHAPLRGRERTTETTKKGKQVGGVRKGILRDPNGVTHHFVNLVHFVRSNPNLFRPDEIEWVNKGGTRQQCRASKGLANLFGEGKTVPSSWHGWTRVSVFERRFSDGEDLLQRQANGEAVSPGGAE